MTKVKQVYNWAQYEEARDARNEDNDCTVVSLAFLLDLPYGLAHGIMRATAGRQHRQPAHMHLAVEAYPAVFKEVEGMPIEGISLAEFCRVHSTGRYWVRVTGHALAVINGKVYDHSRKVRRRVTDAWRVDKAAFHGDK